MQSHQHLPVNWANGMKINKSHFIAQHNAFTSLGARSISSLLHHYNYGLLPHINNNEPKIAVTVDSQQYVNITIHNCTAVTPGGHLIEFNNTLLQHNNLHAKLPSISLSFDELKGAAPAYYIILVMNPYEHMAYGKADPDEIPLRLPYLVPSYTLQLLSASDAGKNVLGDYHLPVAKLIIEQQKVLLDEDYIPPCCCISSHANLLEKHAELGQFLSRVESYALQIIHKIAQKKKNDISVIVQKLCEYIMVFTASAITACRCVHVNQPPVFLYSTISSFAHLFRNVIDQHIGTGKDILMDYFKDQCQINQSELEEVIASLLNDQYNHLDIYTSIYKAFRFTSMIASLFNHLVKLEFIGPRHENGIIIDEKVPVVKNGFSFMG